MCKACVKAGKQSGAMATPCDYPTGHAKRKRKVDRESGSRIEPATNTIDDEEESDSEAEHVRMRRKSSVAKERGIQAQSDSRSQALWDARLRQDLGLMVSPDGWLESPLTGNLSTNGPNMHNPSGVILTTQPTIGWAASEDPPATDQTQRQSPHRGDKSGQLVLTCLSYLHRPRHQLVLSVISVEAIYHPEHRQSRGSSLRNKPEMDGEGES